MFLLQGHLEGAPGGEGALWAWRMSAALLVASGFMAVICTGGHAASLHQLCGKITTANARSNKTFQGSLQAVPCIPMLLLGTICKGTYRIYQ
jgi:hypothetical protein